MKNEIANTTYEYSKAHLNETGGLFLVWDHDWCSTQCLMHYLIFFYINVCKLLTSIRIK